MFFSISISEIEWYSIKKCLKPDIFYANKFCSFGSTRGNWQGDISKVDRSHFSGSVGIVLNTNWDEPATEKKADIDAAERKLMFEVRQNFNFISCVSITYQK